MSDARHAPDGDPSPAADPAPADLSQGGSTPGRSEEAVPRRAPRGYRAAVAVLAGVAAVGTALRLLLTPATLHVLYRLPWISDGGLSLDERLRWSVLVMQAIAGPVDPQVLGEMQGARGPLFSADAVAHLEDVRRVVQGALAVWAASLAGLLGLWVWGRRRGWGPQFRAGLDRGAWGLLAAMALLLVVALVGFAAFFDAFHRLLFAPGTWQFASDSTLIRLFPQAFWQHVLVLLLVLAALPAAGWLVWRRG